MQSVLAIPPFSLPLAEVTVDPEAPPEVGFSLTLGAVEPGEGSDAAGTEIGGTLMTPAYWPPPLPEALPVPALPAVKGQNASVPAATEAAVPSLQDAPPVPADVQEVVALSPAKAGGEEIEAAVEEIEVPAPANESPLPEPTGPIPCTERAALVAQREVAVAAAPDAAGARPAETSRPTRAAKGTVVAADAHRQSVPLATSHLPEWALPVEEVADATLAEPKRDAQVPEPLPAVVTESLGNRIESASPEGPPPEATTETPVDARPALQPGMPTLTRSERASVRTVVAAEPSRDTAKQPALPLADEPAPPPPPPQASFWERLFSSLAEPEGTKTPPMGSPAPLPVDPASPEPTPTAALSLPSPEAAPFRQVIGPQAIAEKLPNRTPSRQQASPEASTPLGTVLFDTVLIPDHSPDEVALALGPALAASAAPSPIAGPTVPASAPMPQIAAQITRALGQTTDGVTELALAPEELGHVRLRLEPDAANPDRMVVMISFERPETLDLFRRHAGELAEAIRAAGYSGADIGFGQERGSSTPDRQEGSGGAGPAARTEQPLHQPPSPRLATGASLDLRL